jgi:3-hydroxyacyl-[acyl-carrier-protein] dehydratase
MLLVDKVLDIDPSESILALKQTTINEPFYSGHFPDNPIMPGVLILEASAQAAGLMMKITGDLEENAQNLFVFAGADQVKFRKQILPGDSLFIEVKKINLKSAFLKAEAKVFLDRELKVKAFSAVLTLAWIKK